MERCTTSTKRGRSNASSEPPPVGPSKLVRFNPEVAETSLGGTEKTGPLKLPSKKLSVASVGREAPSSAGKAERNQRAALSSRGHSSAVAPGSSKPSELRVEAGRSASGSKSSIQNTASMQRQGNDKPPTASSLAVHELPQTTIPSQQQQRASEIVTLSGHQSLDGMVNSSLMKAPLSGNLRVLKQVTIPATPLHQTVGSSGSDAGSGAGEGGCSITVAVRVRPFSQRELDTGCCRQAVDMDGRETTLTNESGHINRFAYDHSFWSFDRGCSDTESGRGRQFASQESVYGTLARPLLAKAIEGYNACLFAYGQTGSGKSFSIMGSKENEGIIPRFSKELFERLQAQADSSEYVSASAEISFFEIYNEKIHDLLASFKGLPGEKKANLKVREHPQSGPYVEGLSSFVVKSFEDILTCLDLGNKQRATASTGMNDKSSRSHSVFTVVLTQRKRVELEGNFHEHSVVSRISLVDLAGSERQSSAQTSGLRLKEGASINKALLVLGTVINLLSDQPATTHGKKAFIPYRDSVLTWLLKDSLGGNSRTAMLATVSPSMGHADETLSTLRYASRARSIVNIARVNEDPNARLIRELRAEIERLRMSAKDEGAADDSDDCVTLFEIATLKRALQEKEREMADIQRSWEERLRSSAESHILEESSVLENTGVALKVDNKLPYLVNLNEDSQLSEVLLYIIKEGQSKVGRRRPGGTADIQLAGALVADDHCMLRNDHGIVTLTPIADAATYVNGQLITCKWTLHHSDRVVIGGNHYFRFNHPLEPGRRDASGSVPMSKDFAFAQSELLRVQNESVQAERERLEELRRKMDTALAASQSEYASRLDEQRSHYEVTIKRLEKDLEVQNLAEKIAREQKLSLEREVLANRKKVLLQSDQTDEEAKGMREKLVRQLAAEKERAEAGLRRIVERRDASARSRAALDGVAKQSPDVCKISLLVREGNQICRHLSKPLAFQIEYSTDKGQGQQPMAVRVTNRKLSASTFWSIAKFEVRVAELREAFGSGEDDDAAIDAILDLSCDRWEADAKISSPEEKPKILKEILEEEANDFDVENAVASPRQWQPPVLGSYKKSCEHHTVVAICEDFIRFSIRKFKERSKPVTMLDQVLIQCECIMGSLEHLKSLQQSSAAANAHENGDATADGVVVAASSSMQLAAAIEALLMHAQLCSSSMCASAREDEVSGSPTSANAVVTCADSLREAVVKAATNAVLLLQGIKNSLPSMVQTASSATTEAVMATCHCLGQLAVMTGTSVGDIGMQGNQRLTQAVADGLSDNVTRTIDGVLLSIRGSQCSLKTVHQSRAKEVVYGPAERLLQLLANLLTSYKGFLKFPSLVVQKMEASNGKCGSSGIKVNDFKPCSETSQPSLSIDKATPGPRLEPLAWQQCHYNCVRCLADIRDALGMLVKPMIRPGPEYDQGCMVRGAEIIRMASDRLANELTSAAIVATAATGVPEEAAQTTIANLARQVCEVVSVLTECVTTEHKGPVASRVTSLAQSSNTGQQRLSFASPLTVRRLAAIFDN